MRDSVRHVVVDTSVLAAAFVPSCSIPRVGEVAQMIIEASGAGWPALKLYVPAICVAETLGVFDKMHFQEKKLSHVEYQQARSGLEQFVADRHHHQFEQQPRHVLAAGLISPINHTTKWRNGRYMGAADCVIAGMSVLLAHQVGIEDVVLLTAESQMAAVMNRARRLLQTDAEGLGLPAMAQKVGVAPWSPRLYPLCVNLRDANDDALRRSLLGWPLPQQPPRPANELTIEDEAALWSLYRQVREQYGFKGRENLLCSPAVDDLRARLACQRRLWLGAGELYHFIADAEKSTKKRRRLERMAAHNCEGNGSSLFSGKATGVGVI